MQDASAAVRTLVITHVNVLPMQGEPVPPGQTVLPSQTVLPDQAVLPNQTVVIREGRIASIATAGLESAFESSDKTQVIDGRGRYLIPGLIDMHVHVDHPSELWIYPAYGVTSVLNLRGLPKHLDWRQDIAAGPSMRPSLWTSGDYVDGDPPSMEPMMSFSTASDAVAGVRSQAAAGYDVIKVYSRLSSEQFEAIGRTARELGIPVVGHASTNYPLSQLVQWQSNISHGEEVIRCFWDPERPDESLEEIVQTLKSSGTSVTANLNFSRSLIRQHQDLESLLSLPEARYLHPAIFQPFRRESNRYARRSEAWLGRVKSGFEVQKKLIRRLNEEGVMILAGTDASTAGVFPGYALAEELQEMVSAGLSPWQALRTATANAGDFLAQSKPGSKIKVGRVAEGYQADLLLLEHNPLDDIGNVSAISGIVLRGHWHSHDKLQAKLQELDRSFSAIRPRVRQLEQLIFEGRIEEARALFDQTRDQTREILFSQYVPFFVGYRFLYGEDGFNPDPRQRVVALGLYEMYAETYPEFHSAHYLLALARQANGDKEGAEAAARSALELHPHHPRARQLLEELISGASAVSAR